MSWAACLRASASLLDRLSASAGASASSPKSIRSWFLSIR
jgi:hypothetical protein